MIQTQPPTELNRIQAFIGERLDSLFFELCSSTDGLPNIGRSPPVLGVTLIQEAQKEFNLSDEDVIQKYDAPLTTAEFKATGDMHVTMDQLRAYIGTHICLMDPKHLEEFESLSGQDPKELDHLSLAYLRQLASSQNDQRHLPILLHQPRIANGHDSDTIFSPVVGIGYSLQSRTFREGLKEFVDDDYDFIVDTMQGNENQLSMLFLLHDLAHELQLYSKRHCDVLFNEAEADVIGIHNFLLRGGNIELVKDFLAIRAVITVLGSPSPGYNTALAIDSALCGAGYIEPKDMTSALVKVRHALETRGPTKEIVGAITADLQDEVASQINYGQHLLEGNFLREPHARRLMRLYIDGAKRLSRSVAYFAEHAPHASYPSRHTIQRRLKHKELQHALA